MMIKEICSHLKEKYLLMENNLSEVNIRKIVIEAIKISTIKIWPTMNSNKISNKTISQHNINPLEMDKVRIILNLLTLNGI